MLPDIRATGDKWQAQFVRGAPDQTFIGIAAAAPELVIEMSDGEPPVIIMGEAGEQMQQHHRIQTAGHGHKNGLASTEKPSGENGFSSPFKQIAHPVMLRATTDRGNI